MLLITDVEVKEVPENIHEIYYQKAADYTTDPRHLDEIAEIAREVVQGHRFRNARGQDMVIGASNKVQDVLGLPFQAFDDMGDDIQRLHRNLINCKEQKEELKEKVENTGVVGRLKYLFTSKL